MKNSFIQDSSYIVDIGTQDRKPSILSTPLPPLPIQHNGNKISTPPPSATIQFRNGKDLNNGNSSEDDLYSHLEADSKLTRQSLSPISTNNFSNNFNSAPRHKSLSGLTSSNLSTNGFHTTTPYNNSSSSLTNGQTNGHSNGQKIVYVTVNDQSFNGNRSNSMPRNNMQQFDATLFSNNYPPLPPRSSQILSKDQTKLSLESGIELDCSDSAPKPVLPKRTNKKSQPIITNLDQPGINISIDIDKNKSSLSTVISSSTSYIEDSSSLNSGVNQLPPPLPSKKLRLPTSRSTTIISVNNNNDIENLIAASHHTPSLINSSLFNNHHLLNSSAINNGSQNDSFLKSTSSISTSSTSSSTNEYSSNTETHGNTTTTTITTNSSSTSESISHQIQNLGLN